MDTAAQPCELTRTPARGYLLCCIERTGSNLLARALEECGVAGRPLEFFNPVEQERPRLRQILGDSTLVTGLRKILAAGTTSNGCFGAKIHWGHLRYLGMSARGEWTDACRTELYDLLLSRSSGWLSRAAALELLRSGFADGHSLTSAYALLRSHLPDLRVIWLRRANMVARAVSLYRARRTGVWVRHRAHAPPSGAVGIETESLEEWDFAEIHRLNCLGYFQEESWERFFHQQGLIPLRVTYESLVDDHEATVRRVLEFLGVGDGRIRIPPPSILRQADASSRECELRYRELCAGLL